MGNHLVPESVITFARICSLSASGFQKLSKPPSESSMILHLAFPYGKHAPTVLLKSILLLRIPFTITVDLPYPVSAISFWRARSTSTVVTMPETAMNENHFSYCGENQVWFAWEVFPMEPVAVAHAVDRPPRQHFRFCITRFD